MGFPNAGVFRGVIASFSSSSDLHLASTGPKLHACQSLDTICTLTKVRENSWRVWSGVIEGTYPRAHDILTIHKGTLKLWIQQTVLDLRVKGRQAAV